MIEIRLSNAGARCVLIAATLIATFSISANAATASGAPMSYKRQLSDCMSRHMADARTLSYNEASKLCKEYVKAQAHDKNPSLQQAHGSNAGLRPAASSVGAR